MREEGSAAEAVSLRHGTVSAAAAERAAATERGAPAVDEATPVTAGKTETEESDAGQAVTDATPAPAAGSEADESASLAIGRGGMPAPLRGSLEVLERQDERLAADGLERIQDEADLSARIANRLLVPLPASDALLVNAELTANHRYCRPWTARFLADLARQHEAAFHRPLQVNSAVRTVAYQRRLMRVNGNAAPAFGELVSPHLMGATIDIGKKQMSAAEIAWMRRRLLALELAGKIDVEEEFEQACFHITVYRSYLPSHRRSIETRTVAKPKDADQGAPVAEVDARAKAGS